MLLQRLITACLLASIISCQTIDELEGTWSSKSNAVFTGPDFYDPVDELLIEPALPGISYSFTKDGFFEQAIYQVVSNPVDHSCPKAVITFQHGKFDLLSNGSVVLNPIAVDGRQLVSDPCTNSDESTYSRFNTTILFQKFAMYVDQYHGRYRLDLFQFDGAPLPPLYLAYKPPMMLPTVTMNPTADPQPSSTSVAKRMRRSLENQMKTTAVRRPDPFIPYIWWTGVSLMAIGATGWYLC